MIQMINLDSFLKTCFSKIKAIQVKTNKTLPVPKLNISEWLITQTGAS